MQARTTRLERITNLVLALLDTARPLSLREIGGAVAGYPSEPGALRQAFERDKRTLRDGGIPVSVERIDGEEQVGYRILPEHYYLPDLGMDAEEEAALSFAVAAVRIEGGVGRDVLAKIGSSDVDALPPVAVLPSLPALGVLQQAVRSRAVAAFRYRGKDREVEPYGLLFRSGAWYLIGRDRLAAAGALAGGALAAEAPVLESAHLGVEAFADVPPNALTDSTSHVSVDGHSSVDDSLEEAGAVRTFRVDRIEEIPRPGEPDGYQVPAGFDVASELRRAPWVTSIAHEAIGIDAPAATEVVMEVDGHEARGAINVVGTGCVEERREDGSVRLRFGVGDEAAFVGWVLGFGDAVEVIAPKELRQRVIDALTLASID